MLLAVARPAPRALDGAARPVLPAWSALPPADQDAGLAVLEGLDIADADLSAVDGERGVVESLADLSDEESRCVPGRAAGAGRVRCERAASRSQACWRWP